MNEKKENKKKNENCVNKNKTKISPLLLYLKSWHTRKELQQQWRNFPGKKTTQKFMYNSKNNSTSIHLGFIKTKRAVCAVQQSSLLVIDDIP